MSISLDYFFNYDGDLPTVAAIIDQTVGSSLGPYGGDTEDFSCRLLSLEFSLGTHTFEDDHDCDFSSFRYSLGTRTPVPDSDIRDVQIGLMTLLPSVLFRRAKIDAGIMVYDVQRLIARYSQKEGAFFDAVSGRIVIYPEHTSDVTKRIFGLQTMSPTKR